MARHQLIIRPSAKDDLTALVDLLIDGEIDDLPQHADLSIEQGSTQIQGMGTRPTHQITAIYEVESDEELTRIIALLERNSPVPVSIITKQK